MEKLAITSQSIDNLLARRWSPRAFNPDIQISEDEITSLCEAARWACSCNNDQPWRFMIFDRHKQADKFQLLFECLDEWNQKWVQFVPLLFVAFSTSNFRHNGKTNRWAQYDTGAASISICYQAFSMGLFAHQMGGFDTDKIKATFLVPDEYSPMTVIAIGHYGAINKLEERHQIAEMKPRERLSLDETFYFGSWGSASNI